MKIDFEVYTQQLNKAYNILAQQVVILDYLKKIINSNNDFDTNINDLTNKLNQVETNLNNHITDFLPTKQWVDSIKDYVIQNENTTEIGGNVEIDGNTTINADLDVDNFNCNNFSIKDKYVTEVNYSSETDSVETIDIMNGENIIYKGMGLDDNFGKHTYIDYTPTIYSVGYIDGYGMPDDAQWLDYNGKDCAVFYRSWYEFVASPDGLPVLLYGRGNPNISKYWSIDNTGDGLKALSMVEHFVGLSDTEYTGTFTIKLLTNENRNLTITDIKDHLYQYQGGPAYWTPANGLHNNKEVVGMAWNATSTKGLILRYYDGTQTTIPVSNLTISGQSHKIIF